MPTVTITVPEELHVKFKSLAKKEFLPYSRMVITLMAKHVREAGPKELQQTPGEQRKAAYEAERPHREWLLGVGFELGFLERIPRDAEAKVYSIAKDIGPESLAQYIHDNPAVPGVHRAPMQPLTPEEEEAKHAAWYAKEMADMQNP